jgi:geranylgeranyl diphosphate synthase type I
MTDEAFFLREYKRAANDVVSALNASADIFAPSFPAGDPLQTEIKRFVTQGGKRLRPAMSLYVARSFGHNDPAPHMALEAFHKYILAHDDIIDRDNMRYGQPTIHTKMAELCTNPHDKTHFGNSLAIVAGNLMQSAAHSIILQSHVPDVVKLSLLRLIEQANDEVIWGWYDQFLMDYLPLDSPGLSLERIEESIVWVTGKYSIKLPLLFGFMVAGQKAPAGLEQLADTLGKLFQVGDDLMGLFGDQTVTGKSASGDITQGKKTIPLWYAYEEASDADKATLRHLVGNKKCTPADAETVRSIIRDSGGLGRAQNCMQTYQNESLTQIAALDTPEPIKQFLRGMVHYLQTRQK